MYTLIKFEDMGYSLHSTVKRTFCYSVFIHFIYSMSILLAKITAARNEVALSYRRVRGLFFLAVIFAVTLFTTIKNYVITEL